GSHTFMTRIAHFQQRRLIVKIPKSRYGPLHCIPKEFLVYVTGFIIFWHVITDDLAMFLNQAHAFWCEIYTVQFIKTACQNKIPYHSLIDSLALGSGYEFLQ